MVNGSFFVSKSLASKCVWNLISGTGLWVKCVKLKYISALIVLDWFRCPTKCRINISICYKVVLQSYDFNERNVAQSWCAKNERNVAHK